MYELSQEWLETIKGIHEEHYRKEQFEKLIQSDAQFIVLNYINTKSWKGALILNRHNNLFITSGVMIWKLTEERKDTFEIIEFIDKEQFFKTWKENQTATLIFDF